MERRDFIKKTGLSSAMLSMGSFALTSFSNSETKHVTILHTNDVHSYIDPFPANHPINPNMGGVANRAALINQIRKENHNVLLLDAGDIFQGTPYFNFFGGKLEYKLMNLMKYDVVTLGNHDFDNGIEGLLSQMPNANFEFVSNYGLSNTDIQQFVKPYTIKLVDGIKIGIFGLGIQLEGLVDKKNYKEVQYFDPIESATDMAYTLKYQEKCDIIVCLSHLGHQYNKDSSMVCDVILAQKTKDIDLIIGGHTHTFLDEPVVLKNRDNQDVIVNQVGCYGINLGRIDFYLTKDKRLLSQGKSITIL
jgi:5'-nucleotidase